MVDLTAIKTTARGRWHDILPNLAGIDAELLDGRNHPCPKCGGVDRFRFIDSGEGAVFCNQCFKKRNGDGIAAVQWLMGKTFSEACSTLANHLGLSSDKPRAVNGRASNGKGRIVASYDYCDEQGRLLYQVVRFDPKDFRQRSPKPDGGWRYNVKGVRLVPYRLPELLTAPEVFIAEGEKDCDRAASIGIVATTGAMGAGKWRPEYNQHFKDKRAVIVPDKDEPGRDHAEQVARNLRGVAASVKLLELPGLPDKGDLSDWLDQGGTAEELRRLVDAAPEWKPRDYHKAEADDRGKLIALIAKGLRETADDPGPAIADVIQRGRQDARYELVFRVEGGEVFVDVGTAREVMLPRIPLAAVAESLHIVPRPRTKAEWFRYGRAIIKASRVVEVGTRDDETATWLASFVDSYCSCHSRNYSAEDVKKLWREEMPIDDVSYGFETPDGEQYISSYAMAEHVFARFGQRVSEREIAVRLSRIGFSAAKLQAWSADSKNNITRRYWRGRIPSH